MSGYTDTFLLEANRRQSSEFTQTDNSSTWTNVVTNGLKLNPGDKVSVESAFISDLGAEDASIEFKGVIVADQQTLVSTNTTTDYFSEDKKIEFNDKPNPYYKQTISKRSNILKNIRDNEANIVVSFHKSSNGEYHLNLPITGLSTVGLTNPDENFASNTWRQPKVNNALTQTIDSGLAHQVSRHKIYAPDYTLMKSTVDEPCLTLLCDNSRCMIFGRTKMIFHEITTRPTDYPIFRDLFSSQANETYIPIKNLVKLTVPTGFNTPSDIAEVITDQLNLNTPLDNLNAREKEATTQADLFTKPYGGLKNETPCFKLFNCGTYDKLVYDNSKKYYGDGARTDVTANPVQGGDEIFNYQSGFQYIGIKRPEIYEEGYTVGQVRLNGTSNPRIVMPTAPSVPNTVCYKKTPTGSFMNQIPRGYDGANLTDGWVKWAVQNQSTGDNHLLDNINPFFTNFIKENPFQNWNDPADAECKYAVINTGYEFNQTNLNRFKKLFEAQGRYSELFDVNCPNSRSKYRKTYADYKEEYNGEDISVDTHRFLHMNDRTNDLMPKELVVNPPGITPVICATQDEASYEITNNQAESSFGYDNIPSVFSQYGTGQGTVNTKDIDFASVPLFVKYDKDSKDSTNEAYPPLYPGTTAPDMSKAWGGFAFKCPSSVFMRPYSNNLVEPGSVWVEPSDTSLRPTFEVFFDKEYNYEGFLRQLSNDLEESYPGEYDPQQRPDGDNPYKDSIYDTICFIAQVPKSYLTDYTIYTKVDANGVYQPNDAAVQRTIKSLYFVDYYASFNDPNVATLSTMNWKTRRIGFDRHPTAYGNYIISLYNGLAGKNGFTYDGEYQTGYVDNNVYPFLDDTDSSFVETPVVKNATPFMNRIYVGAHPVFSFDTTTSRFSFSELHTPEIITAEYDATFIKDAREGDKHGTPQEIPIPNNLGKSCYKINKVFDRRNWTQAVAPYQRGISVALTGTDGGNLYIITQANNAFVKQNSIFDMMCGVFIEEFNLPEDNWNDTFWGICGFKYEDLNIENTGGINQRINTNDYNNIHFLTTNQDVTNSAYGEWSGELSGVASYQPRPMNYVLANFTQVGSNSVKQWEDFAPLQIISDSAKIEATNLPTKTIRPYFTIRSDIISDSYYFSGNHNEPTTMPVIAVLMKNQQYGDFFYGGGDTEFTVTYPRTITEIKTQVCDPSGKQADLSPNSAVIYKIVKPNGANLNVIQDILAQNKKK
jgi:hypothetical protein